MIIYFSLQATLQNNANQFVCTVYSVATGAVVETHPIPPPYTAPFQIAFTTLTPGLAYKFVLWESPDGTPSGISRDTYAFVGQSQTISIREDLQITVGTTPGVTPGTNTYTDETLIGWNYRLVKVNRGPMFYLKYWTRPTQDVIQLVTGLVFGKGEEWNVEFYPQVSIVNTQQSGLPTASRVITATTSLAYTDANTYLYLQGAATYFEVTLPPSGSIEPFTPIYVKSAGGVHINAAILCAGSDSIQRKATTTYLIVGQNENLTFYLDGTTWHLLEDELFYIDNVGQFVTSNNNNGELKAIQCIGQTVSRQDYRRLWEWAVANTSVCTDTQWSSSSGGYFYYRGQFSTGDGSTTFRLPDLTVYGMRRTVLNNSQNQDVQLQNVPAHTHAGGVGFTGSGDSPFIYGTTEVDVAGGAGVIDVAGATKAQQGLTGPVTGTTPSTSPKNAVDTTGEYTFIRF